MSKPKILFMGTPEFAVPSLEILISHNYPVVGVVTQPDRPRGRGQSFAPSPVKVAAQQYLLPIFQPEKVRSPESLDTFQNLSTDLIVVAAFGQILPQTMIEIPTMGCINVHPSLLPKYRGAAPINWSLIRGETKTGVTIMMMDEGLDTGDILTQEEITLEPDVTFGGLHDRLAHTGARLLLMTIEMMRDGAVTRTAQDTSAATYAPRLKKEDGLIHWNLDVHSIVNLIRGLSPVPCAYTFFREKRLKIFSARGEVTAVTGNAGTLGRETDKGLPVTAKNGLVYLKEVQLENKKRMSVQDFLRGSQISPGEALN
jgi:methionyl-tRNA formyltransferase